MSQTSALLTARVHHFWRSEGANRCGFVVPYVKDGIKFGDLENIVDLSGQVQELQFSTLLAHSGKRGDEFADPGAVDVRNIAESPNPEFSRKSMYRGESLIWSALRYLD
jgi:hypothetical protein